MKKMDFLLVGFVKTGTSSLDAMLRQDMRIMLPLGKETQYISNHRNMGLDKFWRTYYPKYRKNKCIGAIEPTYCLHAKAVYEIFGGDIKLIFMMRNPIQAHFSKFKMKTREIGNSTIDMLYRKYSADQLPEMYEHYVQSFVKDNQLQCKDDFLYERWINEYLKYYKLDQMHFILFEDFISEPQTVINGLKDFLGIKQQKINRVMIVNADFGISKNWICRMINKRVNYCLNKCNNLFLKGMFYKLQNKCYTFTLVENKASMSKKTENILRKHYEDTVQSIEKLLQRDLSQVWF